MYTLRRDSFFLVLSWRLCRIKKGVCHNELSARWKEAALVSCNSNEIWRRGVCSLVLKIFPHCFCLLWKSQRCPFEVRLMKSLDTMLLYAKYQLLQCHWRTIKSAIKLVCCNTFPLNHIGHFEIFKKWNDPYLTSQLAEFLQHLFIVAILLAVKGFVHCKTFNFWKVVILQKGNLLSRPERNLVHLTLAIVIITWDGAKLYNLGESLSSLWGYSVFIKENILP